MNKTENSRSQFGPVLHSYHLHTSENKRTRKVVNFDESVASMDIVNEKDMVLSYTEKNADNEILGSMIF